MSRKSAFWLPYTTSTKFVPACLCSTSHPWLATASSSHLSQYQARVCAMHSVLTVYMLKLVEFPWRNSICWNENFLPLLIGDWRVPENYFRIITWTLCERMAVANLLLSDRNCRLPYHHQEVIWIQGPHRRPRLQDWDSIPASRSSWIQTLYLMTSFSALLLSKIWLLQHLGTCRTVLRTQGQENHDCWAQTSTITQNSMDYRIRAESLNTAIYL